LTRDLLALTRLVALQRGPQVLNPQLNTKKWQEGVDFYATGNEPFWSLDLDLDASMRFDVLDGPSLTTPAVPEQRAQDADVVRYRAVTEEGTLTVQIVAVEFADTMADELFSHKVSVDFRGPTDDNDTRYEGCGRFVVDPCLNDIWVLRTIDGEEIDTSGLPKGAPSSSTSRTAEPSATPASTASVDRSPSRRTVSSSDRPR
jgi:uncharacterized membrane protein